jgi:signal transduction histidine kinase
MKLVRKTNTYYLLFLIFLFPVMVIVDYAFIQFIVNNEVAEILVHESQRIEFHLSRDGSLPPSNYILESTPLQKGYAPVQQFRDTSIFEGYADKELPYRTYTFTTAAGPEPMRIILKHVLLEINELIWLLFVSTSLILLLLVSGFYLINRKIYKWAWRPFFENLSRLKKYEVAQKEPIHIQRSQISEFEELNQVITSLIDQVKKDFQNLKEFNENISHEIQTPLAIIRNKVVLLLERKNLDDKDLKLIEAIYHETNKLSKIGKSLTLISRIENQEFRRLDPVEVRSVIENILRSMEEIIRFKNLEVSSEFKPAIIECDHTLADILFTNLIKNAVQHNVEGGSIRIALDEKKFEIINTGVVSEVPSERLFQRFQKGSSGEASLGLGLAISQKICEIYGFRLHYTRRGDRHTFTLFFEQMKGT